MRQLPYVMLLSLLLPGSGNAQEAPQPAGASTGPRQPSPSPLSFDLRLLTVPGYRLRGRVADLGAVRPPAREARTLMFQCSRKGADGKPEPRQLQILMVAAGTPGDAWEALRRRENAPFSRHPPMPGLVQGVIEADRVGHGPLFPPGNYAAAAVKQGFGVSVSLLSGASLFQSPLPDDQIALVDALVRFFSEWSATQWHPRKKPALRLSKNPSPVRLTDAEGKVYSGLQAGFDTFATTQSIAAALALQVKWDVFRETLELTTKDRRLVLQLGSNEVQEGSATRKLYRPVRWYRGQCCLSVEDVEHLFQRKIRQAQILRPARVASR